MNIHSDRPEISIQSCPESIIHIAGTDIHIKSEPLFTSTGIRKILNNTEAWLRRGGRSGNVTWYIGTFLLVLAAIDVGGFVYALWPLPKDAFTWMKNLFS